VTVSHPVSGVLYSLARVVTIPLCGLPEGLPFGERAALLLLGLASNGVYQATRITPHAGALLPHRFTLTCDAFASIGGLLSVALSVRSPPPNSR
jgi:hypothetical protein